MICWFLFKSALGKKFDKILEIPLFVSSRITPAIQIADIFAGIVRNYYENALDVKKPTTDYQHWLKDLYDKIYSKTEDSIQPHKNFYEYGFQRVHNLNYIRRDK